VKNRCAVRTPLSIVHLCSLSLMIFVGSFANERISELKLKWITQMQQHIHHIA